MTPLPTIEATTSSDSEPWMVGCSMDEAIRFAEASALGEATAHSRSSAKSTPRKLQYVLNQFDHSILLDHNGHPVTVDRLLATKPLRQELSSRPGPGGRKLLYLSGEGVTRTLNDIFGFDGWNLQILTTEKTVCQKAEDGIKWQVAYIAHVRITHTSSGTFKEDMGAGDSVDKSLVTAVQHALKGSITDALKRAARHFGDKLGNCLYQDSFNLHAAPASLAEALDQYDKERAKTKFGSTLSTTNSVTCQSNGLMPPVPKQPIPAPIRGKEASLPPPYTIAQTPTTVTNGGTVTPAPVLASGAMNLHQKATDEALLTRAGSAPAQLRAIPRCAVPEVNPPPTAAQGLRNMVRDFGPEDREERPGSSRGHKRGHPDPSGASTTGLYKKTQINPYS